MALVGAGPLRRWVCLGHELWDDLGGRTPRSLIKRFQILAHRAACRCERRPIGLLRTSNRALLVGVGRNQAGIDSEAVTADQSFFDRQGYNGLEHMTEGIAVAEPAVPVLREGRVIWHVPIQPEPAKPAIRQVQMDLFA
jgi:hypothetical protein